MRKLITIVILTSILSACDQNRNENENLDYKPDNIAQKDPEMLFRKWLSDHKLSLSSFIDTSAQKAVELWSYFDTLERKDSLYFWYPSKDSSYFLLTNYNALSGELFHGDSKDLILRFIDNKSKKVYQGLALENFADNWEIDYKWYNENTFYLLEKHKQSGEYEVLRLKMGIDSIWTYRTIKE